MSNEERGSRQRFTGWRRRDGWPASPGRGSRRNRGFCGWWAVIIAVAWPWIAGAQCAGPADFDGDGVFDSCDNCVHVPNPGQEETCNLTLDGDACDTDGDGDGTFDACDFCPGQDDRNCEKLFSLEDWDPILHVVSKVDGTSYTQRTITAAPGQALCPESGARGLVQDPSNGRLLTMLNLSAGDCRADPNRTVFAGCGDPDPCHQFNGDEAACGRAWATPSVDEGPAACWYDDASDECMACGHESELLLGICDNSCAVAPACSSRAEYVGDRNVAGCAVHDGDQPACEQAYGTMQASGWSGHAASCWYDEATDSCRECSIASESAGACTNDCASCGDPARTSYAPLGCGVHDGDEAACEAAFEKGAFACAYTSCWYDAGADECRGCGNSEQGTGVCTNTCDPYLSRFVGGDLISIDPWTGSAVRLGSPGDVISGLAFDNHGTLYGVTGDGACNASTLFMIDKADASAIRVLAMSGGILDGIVDEALAFNPDDGLLYRAYEGFLESIDPVTLVRTPMPVSGAPWMEATGMTWDRGADRFLLAEFTGDLLGVEPSGASTLLGIMDHPSKGLALVEACGDGFKGASEDCDDGNRLDGDCCSSLCTFETEGGACSSDGNVCTDDLCDGSGSCLHVPNSSPCDDGLYCTTGDACAGGVCASAPRECSDGELCTQDSCDEIADACVNAGEALPESMCLPSKKRSLQVRWDGEDPSRNQLKWKWSKGRAFAQGDLGAPDGTTSYALCLYDFSGGVSSLKASISPERGTLWENLDPKGVRYLDKSGAADGVVKVQLKTGAFDRTRAELAASGSAMPLIPPVRATDYFDRDPRVLVQFVSSDGLCLQSAFTSASRNNGTEFLAKVQ